MRLNFSTEPDSPNKRKFLELLTRLILAGQESGELNREVKAQDSALVFAAIYFTVVSYWSLTEGVSLREKMNTSVDVVLKGLSARS